MRYAQGLPLHRSDAGRLTTSIKIGKLGDRNVTNVRYRSKTAGTTSRSMQASVEFQQPRVHFVELFGANRPSNMRPGD